jgi:hypothetical protein
MERSFQRSDCASWPKSAGRRIARSICAMNSSGSRCRVQGELRQGGGTVNHKWVKRLKARRQSAVLARPVVRPDHRLKSRTAGVASSPQPNVNHDLLVWIRVTSSTRSHTNRFTRGPASSDSAIAVESHTATP